jgi:beta-glucosidase-like glycosyl hydrolase
VGGRIVFTVSVQFNKYYANILLQGFVISDWEGLDKLHEPRGENYRNCISSAVMAGMDMVGIDLQFQSLN